MNVYNLGDLGFLFFSGYGFLGKVMGEIFKGFQNVGRLY